MRSILSAVRCSARGGPALLLPPPSVGLGAVLARARPEPCGAVIPLSVVLACARACARPPRAPRRRPARSGRRDTHVGRRCGRPVAHRCDPRCADQGGPWGVQPGRILVPLDIPLSNIRQNGVGFLRVFWLLGLGRPRWLTSRRARSDRKLGQRGGHGVQGVPDRRSACFASAHRSVYSPGVTPAMRLKCRCSWLWS